MIIPEGDLDFLGVGELLVDFISTEQTDWLLNAFTFRKYQGGSPANIAVNMAKLGGSTALIAKTGIGAMAKFLKRELRRSGVETDYLVMDHRFSTSIVFVSRTSGTADSEAFRGGDYHLEPHEVPIAAIRRAKIVHASTWALSREPCRSAVLRAFKTAQRMGKIISFDPNYNPGYWPEYREARRIIDQVLRRATLVKASLDDIRRIYGRQRTVAQAIDLLRERVLGPFVLTMGCDGFILADQSSIQHIEARPIEVQDATGAGDAFWAGFLHALLDGRDFQTCGLFAREVVERKLTHVGHLMDDLDPKAIYGSLPRRRKRAASKRTARKRGAKKAVATKRAANKAVANKAVATKRSVKKAVKKKRTVKKKNK